MWLFKFLMQFPMLKSFLSNQSSATIHLFIKPQPWLFFHLCLLSPNMWWKAETFTSSHFCILAVFPLRAWFWHACQSVLPLQRHRRDGNAQLCSWLQCHADPWLPEGGILLQSFLSLRGLELLTLGVLREGPYQNVKCGLPAMFNSAKCASIF